MPARIRRDFERVQAFGSPSARRRRGRAVRSGGASDRHDPPADLAAARRAARRAALRALLRRRGEPGAPFLVEDDRFRPVLLRAARRPTPRAARASAVSRIEPSGAARPRGRERACASRRDAPAASRGCASGSARDVALEADVRFPYRYLDRPRHHARASRSRATPSARAERPAALPQPDARAGRRCGPRCASSRSISRRRPTRARILAARARRRGRRGGAPRRAAPVARRASRTPTSARCCARSSRGIARARSRRARSAGTSSTSTCACSPRAARRSASPPSSAACPARSRFQEDRGFTRQTRAHDRRAAWCSTASRWCATRCASRTTGSRPSRAPCSAAAS